jgi:hypothetical protein
MILKRFAPADLLVCVVWLVSFGPKAFAQAPADPQTANPAIAEDAEPSAIYEQPSPEKVQPTIAPASKRLLGVVPNNRASQNQNTYTPLTTAEKFRIARGDSFDWPNYFLMAGLALESQLAAGGFSHNGGITGFGEAYGRSVGDQIIGSYVTEAILPSILHEDPRYFRLGSGTFWRRAGYATSRIFVTRMDAGYNRFNVSEIAGNAGFVALATLYYSDSRTVSDGVERYGVQLGNDMILDLLTEFWPDIKHRLRFPRRRLWIIP